MRVNDVWQTPMEHHSDIPVRAPIRVIIFDSTKMGCQLLTRALESSPYKVSVVATYEDSTIASGMTLCDADIGLICVSVGNGQGSRLKLLREIRQTKPSIRCVMLLDVCDREQVIDAFSSGAMGVCDRRESCEVLSKCIDRVSQGQIWANSEQLHYVLETLSNGNRVRLTDARGNALLTQREEDIAYLVAEGMRNREIAEQLKLSEHTIRNYLFRIFEKLGISSRSELILYTLEQRRKTASPSS
jgi:DNA-binding NarL/FixJ family response regulator